MLIAGRRLSDNPRAAFRVICLSVIASTLPLLERIYRA